MTAELRTGSLGYFAQFTDLGGRYDELDFLPTSQPRDVAGSGFEFLYTNVPYRMGGLAGRQENAHFICRRRNWNAECLLMSATRLAGTSVYAAFGGGDLVPMRLDNGVTIDKRQPAHMHEFTHRVTDKQYGSARSFSSGNTPYVVGVTTFGGVVQYTNFSIAASAGVAGFGVGATTQLTFPPNVYVVGEASTTFTDMADLFPDDATRTDAGAFTNRDADGTVIDQQFHVIVYNNLVYLIRAVSNADGLQGVGGAGTASGLLIDTFVPAAGGNLVLAQAARYKPSGLQYFGSTYTPTTMVDTLDQLDFTSITGETFFAPTIFIPIPELDSTKGFVADLSSLLGSAS